jgi:hypothetical protein
LGKDICFGSRLVSEIAARVDSTIEKIDGVLSDVRPRTVRLTWLSSMRSIIGILMYICITKPDLRGLLNAPMRSLKVKTRLGQGRFSAQDQLVPLSYDAGACLETVRYSLLHLEGRPFASKLGLPELHRTIFIIACRGDIRNHILFGYYPVINRPLDMLFNAPTLSFIHTLCVL